MMIKKNIFVFSFVLFCVHSLPAHELCALGGVESPGISEDTPQDLQFAEEQRWLYEIVMPESLRQSQPDETFKSFRVHLKDSYKTFPHPDMIKKANLKAWPDTSELSGTITYVGIVKKSYRMDVIKAKSGYTLNVRVHLKNPTAEDKIQFLDKIKNAERLWNETRIALDFNYQFKFDIVDDASLAHFSVKVLDETRGPYDTNWGRDWTPRVIAHEVGHMLGLGDEYQTLSGKFDCLRPSLMCSAWNGDHMLHHHYFVLRRLIK